MYKDEEEQSLEVIKENAETWLFGPAEIPLDDQQIEDLIMESSLQPSLKKELKSTLENNYNHYIHDHLLTMKSISLSLTALTELEYLPDLEGSICIQIIQNLHDQRANLEIFKLIGFCAETFSFFMYFEEPVIRLSEFLSSDIYNHYLYNDPDLYEIVFENLILQDSQWVRFIHIPIYTFCYAITTLIDYRNEEEFCGESHQEFWSTLWGNNSDKLKRIIKHNARIQNSIYYGKFGTYYFKNYDWEGRLYRLYEELNPYQFNRLYVGPKINNYLNQIGYESEEMRIINFLSHCEYEFYYDDSGAPHSSISLISDDLSMCEHLNITKGYEPYPKQISKSTFKRLKGNSNVCSRHHEKWLLSLYKVKDIDLLKEIGVYEDALGIIQEIEKVHMRFSSGDYSSII